MEAELLKNLKFNLPELQKLLDKVNDEWSYTDGMYRFYHHSFKVFRLQDLTIEIVELLRKLDPDRSINHGKFHELFMEIYLEGTYREFRLPDNHRWGYTTRPIVEAFLHSKYFLEMAVKVASDPNQKEDGSGPYTSAFAGILSLYNCR